MYSQNQEEAVILRRFESPAGNIKPGVLLSIGENDGVTLSNSREIILRGWEADLVEPDPEAYKRLADLYANMERVNVHNIAIGTENKYDADFFSVGTHLNKGDTGLLSSLKEDEIIKRFPGTPYTKTKVNQFTFETFLQSTGRKFYDAVLIDAEGVDLQILRQIDFTALKTQLVCVEWNSQDRHLYDQIMYKFRFSLIHISGENLIYGK